MIIELVRKEFIRQRLFDSSSKWMRSLKYLFKLFCIGVFIALEVITFMSLDKKIMDYSKFGTFDFLILYQFVVMLLVLIAVLVKGRKVLFNKDDNRVVMPLPISKEEIVLSKSLYLYLYASSLLLLLSTPILICYGFKRVTYAYYYVFTFLYPFLVSFFVIGLALCLVALVELFYRLIKVSDLLQFSLACLIVIGLCFGYQFVLNLFLTALSDSSVGGIFSDGFVNGLHNIAKYLAPVSNILIATLNSNGHALSNVFIFLGISLLILVIGYYIAIYFYDVFNNNNFDFKKKNDKQKPLKIVSPTRALIKKEFMMLFKNDAYTFSYTSLLILAPFLSYVVISSLNGIVYQNLEFFSIYFPELINGLNLTLVLLFLTVINSGAALSMSREGKMIQIVKYLPISPLRQIMIKLITPMCLSMISLVVTCLTLLIGGVITPVVFGMSLLLGLILLFADNVLAIEWDMHDKSTSKVKMSGFNALLSLGFPFLILFMHFLLSFLYCPSYVIYLIEGLLGLALLLPCLIKIKARYIKAFKEMEVN